MKRSTSCMFDSSHCSDSCTPCRSANCCARSPLPVSFTACTTVFQVRGRSPVPSLWHNQFSTSCNIRAPTSGLSLLIPSMMAGSTYRNVPNSLHWASSWWSRALITSTNKELTLHYNRQGEFHSGLTRLGLRSCFGYCIHVHLADQWPSTKFQPTKMYA